VNERLLTAREVADLLGVTSETVLRYTRQGLLRGIRLPGTVRGRLRYRSDDIDAWLEQHETAGDGDREVSPTQAVARRLKVSSVPSPTLPVNPATTEEDT
jgi:excisionase family DNA binding protein